MIKYTKRFYENRKNVPSNSSNLHVLAVQHEEREDLKQQRRTKQQQFLARAHRWMQYHLIKVPWVVLIICLSQKLFLFSSTIGMIQQKKGPI